ncbi:DNA-binding response regulator, OmpR family, contains REC and winged-helix (wHTH) domain [Catalinimonas alkaloidigena]|uniref:DNA-binding response regulator, OmpR family, contains REC and winged-helix (WHTH) domain n=1 Tax=Catalinimonas alkaloidigena TaxID=1075417 RepID=A0A1G9PJ46_9BACT|nr:response regulator transcription factor [Catalinimonas alkaloidigena]SDL98818.1 DNA-binding response regulator, OmpR family, contains REC and winged-helix (wHTH) domain [Catalinimonas alkaloidigena]
MKILVVEDEPRLAQFIRQGLEEFSFSVDLAYDGLEGQAKIDAQPYDVLVLDVNLPKLTGFELCRQLRVRNVTTPVLMLTALDATDDKLTGFDAGADDYLTKPFELRELAARLKALYQRSSRQSPMPSNVLRAGDLEMNLDEHTVMRAGRKIDLTAKEFSLLEYFLRNQNKVVSRADIAGKVWDIHFDTGTNVIDVYVNFLRKKVDKAFSRKLIHTVTGVGYVLREEA